MFDRIFDDAKDKNVRAICVYGDGSDGKAYVDAANTTQFTNSELKEAFLKGAIVVIDDVYYAPVNYGLDESELGYVTYVKADSSTATTAVLGTLKAKADSAE